MPFINALREDKGLLHNRYDMTAFTKANPKSSFKGNYCTEYVFRSSPYARQTRRCGRDCCPPRYGTRQYSGRSFPEFKAGLDEVINALREDKGLLHNRYDMTAFTPQAKFQTPPAPCRPLHRVRRPPAQADRRNAGTHSG